MKPQSKTEAYEAIEHNIKLLYTITNRAFYRERYSAIYELFTAKRTEAIRRLLLSLFNFAKDKNLIHYKGYYCFFITTEEVNRLRKKQTTEVSNRWMNFLCYAGFLVKMPQYFDEERNRGHITKINLKMKNNTKGKPKPINNYGILEYDLNELDIIENRLREAKDLKITPGNISKNTLLGHGSNKANELYPQVKNTESFKRKETEYNAFKRFLSLEILENGYSTRKTLEHDYGIDVKCCLRYFKTDIETRWYYKQPNKEQKELLKLDPEFRGWLFFEKKE